MGTLVKIDLNVDKDPTILYVKFDDVKAGETSINARAISFAREHQVVPIEPVLAKIKVRPGKASSFQLHFHGHVWFTKFRVLPLILSLLALT